MEQTDEAMYKDAVGEVAMYVPAMRGRYCNFFVRTEIFRLPCPLW